MSRTPKTQQRILDLLSTSHSLSAGEILLKLKTGAEQVNKTTVYRALEKLLEVGKICRQIFNNDTLVYELREENHHDHLVCESCGKVQSIPCQTEYTSQIKDFMISHHHTTFFGTCTSCSELLSLDS